MTFAARPARPVLSAAAGYRAYLDAAVASHLAPTLRDRSECAGTAVRIAEKFGIDECAAEDDVLREVYMGLPAADLQDALRSPVTRKYARAELARRSA